MSEVSVRLSHSDPEHGIFHDYEYINDNAYGNQNIITLTISNQSGNPICADIVAPWDSLTDLSTGTVRDVVCNQIVIKIQGEIEKNEFLKAIQLILEAEKLVSVLNP